MTTILSSRPSTIGYYLMKLKDGGILRLPGSRDAYCQANGILYRLLVPSVDENVPLFCRLKQRVPFEHLWEALRAMLTRDISVMRNYAPRPTLALVEELKVLDEYISTKDTPITFPDPPPVFPQGDLGRSAEMVETFLRKLSWPRTTRWENSVVYALN